MEPMRVYHLTILENGHSRRFVYEDRDEALARFADAIAAGLDAKLDEVVRAPTLPKPTEKLPDEIVPVRHHGELLGAVSTEKKPGESLTPTERELVSDLGSQAGFVRRNVALIADLRASRQRLVAAQDGERRELERNLHDGAQQQFVALAVKLRLAESLAERDPSATKTMLTDLRTETGEALESLSDLARRIYPPLLADKGLAAALESEARKGPVPTEVRSEGIGRYPPDVESAVYFCVLEALNNVAKYAGATRAEVRLAQANGELTFEVSDYGDGFDPAQTGYGTGLQGIDDRLDAIGGTLEVRSAPGEGTTVTGRIPAQSTESVS
jgi:signal transduction histidine kinase